MERRKDGWKGGQKNKWTVGSEAMRGNQGTGGKRTTLGKEDRGAVTCTLKYTSTSRAACVRFLITLAEGEFLVEELMTDTEAPPDLEQPDPTDDSASLPDNEPPPMV